MNLNLPQLLQVARAIIIYRADGAWVDRHMPGKHNQKHHGWKYGTRQDARQAFKDSDKESREIYKQRARKKRERMQRDAAFARKTMLAAQARQQRGVDRLDKQIQATTQKYEKVNVELQKLRDRNGTFNPLLFSNEADRQRGTKLDIQSTELALEANQLWNRRSDQIASMRTETRQMLYVDNPTSIKARKTSSFRGERGAKVDRGISEFEKLVSTDIVRPGSSVNVKGERSGRSNYFRNNINMAKNAGERTTVHELGHWVEDINPSVHAKAVNFLRRRTEGEAVVSLRQAMNNPGYRSSELTQIDRFIDPYMGKLYVSGGRQYATEILSMGLEYMYSDPITFAQKDPEYFDFIYDTVRGR